MRFLFQVSVLLIGVLQLVSCAEETEKEVDNATYYLVGEKLSFHHDSYLLRLTDIDEIKKANQILTDSLKSRPIVFVRISKNSGENNYVNKDLIGGRIWTWHTEKLIGFPDLTAEIFDAHPGYVEDNYDEWVRITKDAETGEGVIGFWNYTLIRKVDQSELK